MSRDLHAARARLEREQTLLLRALVENDVLPSGFDQERLVAAARVLCAKRQRYRTLRGARGGVAGPPRKKTWLHDLARISSSILAPIRRLGW